MGAVVKIRLESTSQIIRFNGVECRVWEGTSERGIAIVAFIPRLAVSADADSTEFDRELLEQPVPREPTVVWPSKLVN